jgi:hypothetical protein
MNPLHFTEPILIDETNTDIKRKISSNAHENCHRELDITYIKTCITDFDKGYTILLTKQGSIRYSMKKDSVCGFILFTSEPDGSLYITIFCVNSLFRGMGYNLMQKVFEYAKQNNKSHCQLDSVPKSIDKYLRYGYIEIEDHNNNNYGTKHMVYTINEQMTSSKKKSLSIAQIKKNYAKYVEDQIKKGKEIHEIFTLDEYKNSI